VIEPRSTPRIPAERLEEFDERAGIREFDGGMDRPAAEVAALNDLGLGFGETPDEESP
jgi:hypothetical protein